MMKKIAAILLMLLGFVALSQNIPQLLLLVSAISFSIASAIAIRGKNHERKTALQIWS